MSRQIDISNPENLSDEDRAYLAARGRPGLLAHLDYMARVNAARDGRTEVKKVRQPADVVETEEVDEPYEEWTVSDLRLECRNRKLPAEGNKSDLVARLEAHDANSD